MTAQSLSRVRIPFVEHLGIRLTEQSKARASIVLDKRSELLNSMGRRARRRGDDDARLRDERRGARALRRRQRRSDRRHERRVHERRHLEYFNDVDYCLRAREAGYRVIWTPHATLYHHESVSRGSDDTPEKRARAKAEAKYMRTRWRHAMKHDPFYNPNLSYERADFSLSHAPMLQRPWQRRPWGRAWR